jgi:hypothetical protein
MYSASSACAQARFSETSASEAQVTKSMLSIVRAQLFRSVFFPIVLKSYAFHPQPTPNQDAFDLARSRLGL